MAKVYTFCIAGHQDLCSRHFQKDGDKPEQDQRRATKRRTRGAGKQAFGGGKAEITGPV